MRIDPSPFTTGTMGAAQSAHSIASIIPSFSSRSNSLSTLFLRANGTGRGLQNLGCACGSILIWAFIPLISPSSSLNTCWCFCKILSRVPVSWSWWISGQSSLSFWSQLRPNKLDPFPFTTNKGRHSCWSLYSTCTETLPSTSNCSPV